MKNAPAAPAPTGRTLRNRADPDRPRGTTIAISTSLRSSFADAVARTRDALAGEGFGILPGIDMKATLKQKLCEDMEGYLILGACNPPLAHRAVAVDRQIGLLFPCNVVVRSDPTDSSRDHPPAPCQMSRISQRWKPSGATHD